MWVVKMKCPACQSDDTEWVETILVDQQEGCEEYACIDCKSHFELGIKIVRFIYTHKDNVFPPEKE